MSGTCSICHHRGGQVHGQLVLVGERAGGGVGVDHGHGVLLADDGLRGHSGDQRYDGRHSHLTMMIVIVKNRLARTVPAKLLVPVRSRGRETGEIMDPSARERMVESAVVLLAKRGFQGASFTEVLAHSRAPRGSIYHHFPDGKEQLIAAAIDYTGARAVLLLDALAGAARRRSWTRSWPCGDPSWSDPASRPGARCWP